jgi:hypothetical protein
MTRTTIPVGRRRRTSSRSTGQPIITNPRPDGAVGAGYAALAKVEPVAAVNHRHPGRNYAMTRNARIKSIVRGVKYRAREAE